MTGGGPARRTLGLGAALTSTPGHLALSLVLGLACFFRLFGWGPFDPTNVDWIFGDNALYYMGWALYRHDSHLGYPLTWTDRIGYPYGTSVGLMDAVPLVATVLRPLSPVLPEPFQYLGLYSAACFVLQACFALRLCRRFFPDSPSFAVAGSLLFLLSAPLTWRAFGHTALLGHWLLLAALDGWFRPVGGGVLRWMRRLWLVLALAAGVTPYIAAMCFLIAMAGVVRLVGERRCRWRQAVICAVATTAVLLGTLSIFGVLVGSAGATYWAPGYGAYSMNLNAPINPMQYGSALLPALPVVSPAQVEGYNYLGLGVLGLLVVGLTARRPSGAGRLTARSALIVALALAFTLLAASETVTFGSSVLVEWNLPAPVSSVLGAFRASGRFFWPVYYLLILAALVLTARWCPPRARTLVVLAAVALQLLDLHGLQAQVRTALDHRFPSELEADAWRGLGTRSDNLVLVPAWQCSPEHGAGGIYSYVTFGKLAARERMRTNSYYASRYTREQMWAHCVELLRVELDGTLDPRSAYVVTDAVATVWGLRGVTSHACSRADGYNLCVPADTPAAPPSVAPASPYSLGTRLDLTAAPVVRRYLTVGWSDALPAGSWTVGPLAFVRLGLDPPPDPAATLVLSVDATPFLAAGHRQLGIEVVVNGQRVGEWSYRSNSTTPQREARFPAALAAARRGLDIELRVLNPESPMYSGVGPESSFLGIQAYALTVRVE